MLLTRVKHLNTSHNESWGKSPRWSCRQDAVNPMWVNSLGMNPLKRGHPMHSEASYKSGANARSRGSYDLLGDAFINREAQANSACILHRGDMLSIPGKCTEIDNVHYCRG